MATLYIAILLVLFFLPAITNKSNKKSDTRIDVKIENSPKKRAKHKKQDTDSEILHLIKKIDKKIKKGYTFESISGFLKKLVEIRYLTNVPAKADC